MSKQHLAQQKLAVGVALASALVAAAFLFSPQKILAQQGEVTITEATSLPAGSGVNDASAATQQGVEDEPGGLMDRAASSGAQIYVDDSFASVEKIRAAGRLASQHQPQLAINAYQAIIDNFGQKLVYLKKDSFVSITDYVQGKLLAMPEVRSGMYDQLYGAQAKKEIEGALQGHDLTALIRACDRYFPATATVKGLSTAGEWYFERGDFPAASRTWQLLLKHPAAKSDQAEFLFRAAVAESLAGDMGAAKLLRNRLAAESPTASGTVAGEQVTLLTKLDQVLALPPYRDTNLPTDEWPAFQGGPSRSNLLNVNSSIGARLWGIPIEDPGLAGPHKINANANINQRRYNNQEPLDSSTQTLSSHPVLSGGMIFIHTGERVAALSANAGTLLWSYPQQIISSRDANQEQVYNNYPVPYRPVAHDSAAVLGDELFAVLPARQDANDGEVNPYGLLTPSTRMVCLNRADGREIWSKSAGSIKLESKGRLVFVGSPIATRQGIFVMARKAGDASFMQLYLIRLDRETGNLSWSCYLCSASNGAYYGPLVNLTNIPIPTLVDDILYISTGQGADCAVDANAGRILWLQITESAKKARSPNDFYNPQYQFNPSWKFNPPLVHGDKLVCFDAGTLHFYNRWNGKLLASLNTHSDSLTENPVTVVAGIIGSKVILVGSSVLAVDVDDIEKTTTPAWTVDFPASDETGKLQGRPFLSSTGLYVPFDKGLLLVDPQAGKMVDFWLWPRNDLDVPGLPGNLLVTPEQVVVVNDTEVAGYSRWETARDNRLAKIKAHPDDPLPYLALAEISFRTNHLDLAQENMKLAVTLATALSDAAVKTETLDRLYRTNLNFAEQLLAKPEDQIRDRSRFYYEQCKITARTPEQQAEWRLCLSELPLAQKKPEEAAGLYEEVLLDPALRAASFHRGETLSRAGVTAEQKFRTLIDKNPDIYKRFEDQAATQLALARQQKDTALLQQVVDAYPNSASAIDAAGDLSSAYREKQDWLAQLKILRWIYPHASGDKKGRTTAELALANLSLKRYAAAVAWADRGLRQFKDLSWTDPVSNQPTTFAALRDNLLHLGPGFVTSRRPILPAPQPDGKGGNIPPMDESSMRDPLTKNGGIILCPLEDSPALHRPNQLFTYRSGTLSIFDTSIPDPGFSVKAIKLPLNSPTLLLGCSGDFAILAQARGAVAINTKTDRVAWTQQFTLSDDEYNRQSELFQRLISNPQDPNAPNAAPNVIINNGVAAPVDANGNPLLTPALDSEIAHLVAFNQLGRVEYSTLHLSGNKLFAVAGNLLTCYDITTGKSLWKNDANGALLRIRLPDGLPIAILSTDDTVVVQLATGDHGATTFYVVDADSGKFRKQIKLDDERALWRTLSDDGILFTVSDKAVAAYDLFADSDKPLWRRADLSTKYPSATVLTIDGLVLVNSNQELSCLSLEGGEPRWPAPGSPAIRFAGADDHGLPTFFHTAIDGDQIIYQTNQALGAYYSSPQAPTEDQEAWFATIDPTTVPPLSGFQLSDPYVVLFANGAIQGAQHAVHFLFFNHKGGRRIVTKKIEPTAGDPEGPVVKNFQVLDNGIAIEANGTVYFYHAKAP